MHVAVGEGFEPLGFAPEFEVELAPEFPGTGSWSHPVHAFDLEGRVVQDPVSRWGAPAVLVVEPAHGLPWVGIFSSSGRGQGFSGAVATPNPRRLCVAVKGATYLVDVDRPQQGALVTWAQQLVGISSPALLLAASTDDVVAYGVEGLAWRSPRLAVDGLRITEARDGTITVLDLAGDGHGEDVLTTVDVHTGRLA